MEWWSHKVELLQGKVLSGKLVRPLTNDGTKTKVARWTAEIPITFHLDPLILVKLIILIITFKFGFWFEKNKIQNMLKSVYKATSKCYS